MKIFRSDDVAKFESILMACTLGRIFKAVNPRTGETEICFETNREPAELLSDRIRLNEIFDEVWNLTEMYDQMSYVYDALMRKYDWSEVETRGLVRYLHLATPKNENGNQITLKSWKKCRNKDIIYEQFMSDNTIVTPTYSNDFVITKMMMDDAKVVDISKVTDKVFTFPKFKINYPTK